MESNFNNFRNSRVGDNLYLATIGDVVVVGVNQEEDTLTVSGTTNSEKEPIVPVQVTAAVRVDGGNFRRGSPQVLFFSKPNVIATPEPVRVPDYKNGQLIAVWNDFLPSIRRFSKFGKDGRVRTYGSDRSDWSWDNYCSIEELPEVLEKWGG